VRGLAQQFLGVRDQLVGDRFGIDPEAFVGDGLGDAGDLLGIELGVDPATPASMRAALESSTCALASASTACTGGVFCEASPVAARPVVSGATGGLSAGLPIFMGLSRGSGLGPPRSTWTLYRPGSRRL
jgi:hypothetical protein